MKKLLAGGIILTGVLIGWGCEKAPVPTTSETTKPAVTPEAVKAHTITDAEVGQPAVCPVMGTEVTVTKNTLSAEYKGKVYYFCCGGCPDEFKANPDKYAK
ncbi:MAG: YHS domain-containing protein [Planctomycetota bacterium]